VNYAALPALPAPHGAAGTHSQFFGLSGGAVLEPIRSTCSSNPMAKASKSGRPVIPEPSFGLFLRAFSSGDGCHAFARDHHDGIFFAARIKVILSDCLRSHPKTERLNGWCSEN
jgi:hypothetical protein